MKSAFKRDLTEREIGVLKQVCDIDLNTCAIKPIGNYYESDSSMSVFGGIHDGNGYVIKNGSCLLARAVFYLVKICDEAVYHIEDALISRVVGMEAVNCESLAKRGDLRLDA